MASSFVNKAVLENNKGGKVSEVEITITLREGGHSHLWKWSGTVTLKRNGQPLRKVLTTQVDDKSQLLRDLANQLSEEITKIYISTNVDTDKISEFINTSVNGYLETLSNSK